MPLKEENLLKYRVCMKPIFSKTEKNILAFFSLCAFLWAALAYVSVPSGALEVHFLDVGQGDSIFIQTPEHYQILIDGGPEGSAAVRGLGGIMPFYDRSIDLLVATHLDADHIGGLLPVLNRFKVGAVLVNKAEYNSLLGERFFQAIDNKGIKLVLAEAGDSFIFDNNIRMNVLWPPKGDSSYSDNEASVVAKLIYKEDSFLFTGDIEKRAELSLSQYANIQAEVLKVGHHGSKTSSNGYFLEKVRPKIAVIQSGKENRYGHPHKIILERLKDRGVEILRNDINGVISIYSYGNSI